MIGLGADKNNCLKGWVIVCSVNRLRGHVGPEGKSNREKVLMGKFWQYLYGPNYSAIYIGIYATV